MKWLALPLTILLAACGDGGGEDGGGDASGTEESGSDTGNDTGEPEFYGPCDSSAICFENYEDPTCIEPADGAAQGFCTEPCSTASDCEIPSTGNPGLDCMDLTGMGEVCVLLCNGPSACPDGMLCKAVATNQGALDICFWPLP
jgi:hypothetical protein